MHVASAEPPSPREDWQNAIEDIPNIRTKDIIRVRSDCDLNELSIVVS